MKAAVVVVAAGRGERFGGARNKVYLPLGERPILAHAVAAFAQHPQVLQLVVVVAEGEAALARQALKPLSLHLPCTIRTGALTRQGSVHQGLQAVATDLPLVLVHDGARPCVSRALLDRVLHAAEACGAALPAIPIQDSLKRADEAGFVADSPSRQGLYLAQTPQGFHTALLRRALERALEEGKTFSDDAAAVACYCETRIKLVEGDVCNVKVTTPQDLELAARWLR